MATVGLAGIGLARLQDVVNVRFDHEGTPFILTDSSRYSTGQTSFTMRAQPTALPRNAIEPGPSRPGHANSLIDSRNKAREALATAQRLFKAAIGQDDHDDCFKKIADCIAASARTTT